MVHDDNFKGFNWHINDIERKSVGWGFFCVVLFWKERALSWYNERQGDRRSMI